MTINSYLSVLTLKVNGLNAPIKRHRVTEWIIKQDPSICCLQETHFRPKDTFRLKIRGWRTIYHANGQQKKAGVAILISDNLDFKIKTVIKRYRRALYHNQEVYPPRRPSNCKHLCAKCGNTQIYKSITNIKKPIDNNTMVVRDFNIHFQQRTHHPSIKSTRKQGLQMTHWPVGLNRYFQNISY